MSLSISKNKVLQLVFIVFAMKKVPRIVVVGAGIAGIAAASALRDAGFSDVTILEATGEIGGRIGKYQLGKAWIDTGAQYIHGTSETNPVYCLSKKFGILDNVPKEEGRWSILSEKGSRIDEDFAERVYEAGEMLIRKRFQDHQRSIGEHFVEEAQKLRANWEASTEEKRLIDGILSMVGKDLLIDIGASDLNSVSLGSWKYFHGDIDEDLNIEGNMFDLPSKLLKEFPDESLLLKKPVRKIEWDGSFRTGNGEQHPVRVEFGDEEEILADHVVVTISLGCLKAQASTLFSPQLPEHKLQAIDRVRFGTLTKIFLVYEEAFWGDDVSEISLLWEDESPISLDADPAQWIKRLHFFSVMKPKEKFGNVLIGWCAGRVGELTETMKEEDLLAAITEHLRAFTRNPSLPPPKSMFRTQWYSNPFTRGAYTYLPVGTDAEVMDTLALPLSASKATEPDLQVLFAGEATMKSLYSTVQGALLSGQREAQRLAQHYGKVASPASHCSLSPQQQGEPLQHQTVAENLLPAACTYHTTSTRHNSNKISVTRSGRWKYERSYPVLLVRPDGSTISIRYKEPRRILMMPLDISTLSEEEKKARLKKHEQKRAEVKPVVEEFEDDFKVDDYSKFWKK